MLDSTPPATPKQVASSAKARWARLPEVLSANPYSQRPAYSGPERRSGIAALGRLLSSMLDEVDYGMLLLDDRGHLLHLNHVARTELSAGHPLGFAGQALSAHDPHDAQRLTDALTEARRRGRRRMIVLGEGAARVSVAVVPLLEHGADRREAGGHSSSRPSGGNVAPHTLVMLGKRQVCEGLSVEAYARLHGLTPAETAVLAALCAGERPSDIARRKSVAISTVRTQVGKIRAKTGMPSIAAALQQMAVLPPMVAALRDGGGPAH